MATTHLYLVGMTRTGKTTLARALASSISRSRHVLIYDPTQSANGHNVGGWPGLVCADWEMFRESFWASRNCFVIIDEAPTAFREHGKEATPMILRGRHQGHVCAMLSQRHVLMDKSARGQASQLFAFTVDPDDSDELARDWNCPALRNCYQLPPHSYISLSLHGKPRLGRTKKPR